jgi:organic hydroperoxide reductase OsmC/OhrA
MGEHRARIAWKQGGGEFSRGKYSREHSWSFDGGQTVLASSSPSAVPVPLSNPAGVDPEEALVASLSSCHMLTFLFLAYKQGFQIESYVDDASGTMARNERGIPWVDKVTLRPEVKFVGERRPSVAELEQLHHDAHEQCFISNSVKSEIIVEPVAAPAA